KDVAENPHESGENDQTDVVALQNANNLEFEVFALPFSGRNKRRLQTAQPRICESRRVFDVTDDHSNFRIQSSRCDVVGDRLKVGAATREKDSELSILRLDFHAR